MWSSPARSGASTPSVRTCSIAVASSTGRCMSSMSTSRITTRRRSWPARLYSNWPKRSRVPRTSTKRLPPSSTPINSDIPTRSYTPSSSTRPSDFVVSSHFKVTSQSLYQHFQRQWRTLSSFMTGTKGLFELASILQSVQLGQTSSQGDTFLRYAQCRASTGMREADPGARRGAIHHCLQRFVTDRFARASKSALNEPTHLVHREPYHCPRLRLDSVPARIRFAPLIMDSQQSAESAPRRIVRGLVERAGEGGQPKPQTDRTLLGEEQGSICAARSLRLGDVEEAAWFCIRRRQPFPCRQARKLIDECEAIRLAVRSPAKQGSRLQRLFGLDARGR